MADTEFERLMEALGRSPSIEKEALSDMSKALRDFENAVSIDPRVLAVLGNLEERISTIRMTHGPVKRLTELTDAVVTGPYKPSIGLGPKFAKPAEQSDG